MEHFGIFNNERLSTCNTRMLNHHPGASRHPSWPGGAIAQLLNQSSMLSAGFPTNALIFVIAILLHFRDESVLAPAQLLNLCPLRVGDGHHRQPGNANQRKRCENFVGLDGCESDRFGQLFLRRKVYGK